MKRPITLSLLLLFTCFLSANAQTWTPLASGLGSGSEQVRAIAVNSSGFIYAGGTFSSFNHIAKWTGSAWEEVGGGVNGPVYAIALLNSDVYVGGLFTTAGGVAVHNVAKFSNGVWSDVDGGFNDQVNVLYVGQSSTPTIYAGGKFSASGSSATAFNHIAKFTTTTSAWESVGGGISAIVNAITTHNSVIYAGSETTSGPVHKFDGTAWSTVGSLTGKVYALASFSNNLYAGGESLGSFYALAKFDGSVWGTAVTQFSSSQKVYALYARSSNSIMYVGGNFTGVGVGSPNYIAKVTIQNSLPTPLLEISTSDITGGDAVYAIGNSSGKVIAGGRFTSPASNITISSDPIGINEIENAVAEKSFYPNPVSVNGRLNISLRHSLSNPVLNVYDVQSKLIETLQPEDKNNPTQLNFIFNRKNLPSGNYYYNLISDEGNVTSDQFIVE